MVGAVRRTRGYLLTDSSSFHKFALLPNEFQHMIWQYALQNARLIYIHLTTPVTPIKTHRWLLKMGLIETTELEYYRWIALVLTCRHSFSVARLADAEERNALGGARLNDYWCTQRRWKEHCAKLRKEREEGQKWEAVDANADVRYTMRRATKKR